MPCSVDILEKPALFWGGSWERGETEGERRWMGNWEGWREGSCGQNVLYERKVEESCVPLGAWHDK